MAIELKLSLDLLICVIHHWMGIQSIKARKHKRNQNQKTKTYFVCPYLTSLEVLLFCCKLGQVCLEETWSLDTICVIRQAKRIYRWQTFIFSTIQLKSCKRNDMMTGTIWAALMLFVLFCCCVIWGISLWVCPTLFNVTTKAATVTKTKHKT